MIVTGLGICSAIGQGVHEFYRNLIEGRQVFAPMNREGRYIEGQEEAHRPIAAEITDELRFDQNIPEKSLRNASWSAQVAVATLAQAWRDARLDDVNPRRIGLILGGSNLQQRTMTQAHDRYREKIEFLRPSYGFHWLDTDICGLCTDLFPIKGFAYSLGAASASGSVAAINGIQALASGQVDVCIVIGGLSDLSYWEVQGFQSLGAMSSKKTESAGGVYRPFDRERSGFIFGESCGAMVIERLERPSVDVYGRFCGWGIHMDGNRNPNPSLEGECEAIRLALDQASWRSDEVDYINPHGSGSILGDEIELKALAASNLRHALMNTTKSIVGHGLTAAGTVELIASLLQVRYSKFHPSLNLDDPIDSDFNWVRDVLATQDVRRALSLSIGFNGTNSAICIEF